MSTDQVNEARTAFRHYRGSNGAHISLSEPLDVAKVSLWKRFKKRHFKWESLTMAGREVKGLLVTPTMGLTIVLALGGVLAAGYKSLGSDISEQRKEARESRDLMIEVKTRLEMKDKYDQGEFQKLNGRIDDTNSHMSAVETVTNKQIAELKAKKGS